jgi:cell division protein FtsL
MANRNYWNTSEAFELYPEIAPRITKLRKVRKHVKAKPVFVYTPSGKRVISLPTVFTLILIFAGALAVSLSFSSFYMGAERVSALQDELSKQRGINSELEVRIADGSDLESLRKTAQELGMSEPKPYQSFKVAVPEGSYAVSSVASEDAAIVQEEAKTGLFFGLLK